MASGEDVVTAARGWLGTRFAHQGRLKKTDRHKGGVDCLGLLVGIAAELTLAMPDGTALCALDRTDYPHYPDTDYLRRQLARAMREMPTPHMRPGDVMLLCIDTQPQHLAIVSDRGQGYGMIHAYAPARAVVEHALDGWWMEKISALFRF